MQPEPIAVREIPSAGIRGLGVCDAFAIELTADQIPWLVDELEERRGPLDEALQAARSSAGDHDETQAVEHELRQLRGMRDQLPPGSADAALTFVCPGVVARELIHTTTQNVIAALGELVDGSRTNGAEARARLGPTMVAAAAWVRTLLGFHDVEAFSFDPTANPLA